MAKGSNYMRGLCIVLNFLLAFSGVILLLFGTVAKTFQYAPMEQGWTQFVLLSVGIGLATILLSILGVYGAYREQVLPLLLYSVFMAIELTVLMVLAIIATLAQPQLEREIQQNFARMIPLENKPDVFQTELKELQKEAQCCGLTKFTDWRDPPPSCLCPPDFSDKEIKCVQKNISELIKLGTEDTELVYNTECGPILVERAKKDWRVLLGILFTLATIKIAAVVVALLLWYKIHTQSPGTGHSQDNNSRTKYELQPDKMP